MHYLDLSLLKTKAFTLMWFQNATDFLKDCLRLVNKHSAQIQPHKNAALQLLLFFSYDFKQWFESSHNNGKHSYHFKIKQLKIPPLKTF